MPGCPQPAAWNVLVVNEYTGTEVELWVEHYDQHRRVLDLHGADWSGLRLRATAPMGGAA